MNRDSKKIQFLIAALEQHRFRINIKQFPTSKFIIRQFPESTLDNSQHPESTLDKSQHHLQQHFKSVHDNHRFNYLNSFRGTKQSRVQLFELLLWHQAITVQLSELLLWHQATRQLQQMKPVRGTKTFKSQLVHVSLN